MQNEQRNKHILQKPVHTGISHLNCRKLNTEKFMKASRGKKFLINKRIKTEPTWTSWNPCKQELSGTLKC
jgi:hypothetical protein